MAWLTDWAWRKQIDLPIPDANLTDFPVCIKIVADAEIGDGALATGYDIRFTESDGVTLLDYERESWAGGGGAPVTAIFWVKTDVATAGTYIWCYYGNHDATDVSTAVAPTNILTDGGLENWSSPTALVSWGQYCAGTSTVNRESTEKHGGNYASRHDVDATNDTALITQAFSLTDGNDYKLFLWYKTEAGKTFDILIRDTVSSNYIKPDGTWSAGYYGITILASTSWTLYVLSFTTCGSLTAYEITIGNALWGGNAASSSFYLDDILIEDITGHSADWLDYEYTNMNLADGGLTWGEEESAYTGTGTGTSTATGAMNISKSLLGSSVGSTVAAAALSVLLLFSAPSGGAVNNGWDIGADELIVSAGGGATSTATGWLAEWVSLSASSDGTSTATASISISKQLSGSSGGTSGASAYYKSVHLQSAQTDGSGEGGVGWDIGADELPSTSASGAFAKSGASANLQAYIGETGWDIGADEYSGAGGYTWWLTGSATAESGASATLYGAVVSLTGTANAYLTLSTGEYQTHSLTGTSATVCSPSAVLSGMVKFLGSVSSGASSASAGTLNLLRPLSASVSQDSFAQGRLYVFSLLGASGGTSSATGSLTLSWRLFGSSAGASGATATLAWGEVSLTGTSAGASSATAHLGLPVEMTGTSAGASTAKASLGGSLSSQSVIYVKMDGVWQAIGSGGSSSGSLGVWIVGTITVQPSSYTVLPGVEVVVCNSEEAMTVTCPAATGSGSYFTVKNINSGTVTLDGAGAETIDGDTTQSIAQWEALTVLDYTSGKWISI